MHNAEYGRPRSDSAEELRSTIIIKSDMTRPIANIARMAPSEYDRPASLLPKLELESSHLNYAQASLEIFGVELLGAAVMPFFAHCLLSMRTINYSLLVGNVTLLGISAGICDGYTVNGIASR